MLDIYASDAQARYETEQNMRQQRLQAGQFAFDVVQQRQQRMEDQAFQMELNRVRQRDALELARFRTNEEIRLMQNQPTTYEVKDMGD